jgi:hypothetical protein
MDPGLFGNVAFRREYAEHIKIVRGYSHPIIISPHSTEQRGVGTAVAFRAGDRLFAITAGHCITIPFEVHLLVGGGRAIRGEILNSFYHPDWDTPGVETDVGFVELENRSDVAACRIEQLYVESGNEVVRPVEGRLLHIAGFPEFGFNPDPRPVQCGLSVIPGRFKGATDTRVELAYAEHGFSLGPDGATCEPATFPATPRGFSGGGVWGFRKTEESELFLPHRHILMIGTQFAWNSTTRTLFAVPTGCALAFLFARCPELKAMYGPLLHEPE